MSGSSTGIDREAAAVMGRVARTFDLATRLLPGDRRRDVRRLYLALRTLDDLVDRGDPQAGARVAAVEAWASTGRTDGPEARILDELADRHPGLPRDAVLDFCAGMRHDLAGAPVATDDDLDRYCYRVAGTVGRLMVVLLGTDRGPGAAAGADEAARTLGRAMQLTNILRDLREDGHAGRVYLPLDALAAAGLERRSAAAALAAWTDQPVERRRTLLAPLVARADADYEAGLSGTVHLRAGRRAIVAAARLYREILREIERDAYGGSGRRAVVGRVRKARIVISSVVRPVP